MAMDIKAFMRQRMQERDKRYTDKVDEATMKELRSGLKEYGDEVALHYKNLTAMIARQNGQVDEELLTTQKQLNSMIRTMQKMDDGQAVTPADMDKWFKKFHASTSTLQNNQSYTEASRDQKQDMERERKERVESEVRLSELLGRKFEDAVVENAHSLGAVQGSLFKVGLASFLGPAAPLVGVLDSIFGIDEKMAGFNVKMVTKSDKRDEQAMRDQRVADDEQARDQENDQQQNRSIWSQMLDKLGLISTQGKKQSGFKTMTDGILKLIRKPFDLLMKLPVFKWLGKIGGLVANAARFLGPVAAAGAGILGTMDAHKRVDRYKHVNEDGSVTRDGLFESKTGSVLDTRAANYGEAAVSGAMIGATVGSVIPGLGTAVGAGVGAAIGAGALLVNDYKEEISAFLESTGVNKLAKDSYGLLTTGLKKVGGWVSDAWDMVDESGVLPALGTLGYSSVKGVVQGIRTVAGWIGSLGTTISDSGVMQTLWEMEKVGWSGVFGAITGIADWLTGLVDAASSGDMLHYLADTWDSIKSSMSAVMNGVWTDVTGWFSSKLSSFIVDPMKRTIGAMVTGVSSMINSVLNTIESIPGVSQLTQGARKMASDLAGKGSDLLSQGMTTASNVAASGSAYIASAGQTGAGYIRGAAGSFGQGVADLTKGTFAESTGASVAYGANAVGNAYAGGLEGASKLASSGLGALSAKFESGSKGGGAIGYDSTGGLSYGKYQIATKTGTMAEFLQFLAKSAPDVYQQLAAAGDPSVGGKRGPFAQAWQAIYAQDPKRFEDLQHKFIQSTHYDPAAAALARQGFDIGQHSKTLQDVLWSTAVQHGAGGATSIFAKAIKMAGPGAKDTDLIPAIYQVRSGKFGSSTQDVRASVMQRFQQEQGMALASVSAEAAMPKPVVSSPSYQQTMGAGTVGVMAANQPSYASPVALPTAGNQQRTLSDVSGAQGVAATGTGVQPARPGYDRVAPQGPQVVNQQAAPAAKAAQVMPMPQPTLSVDSVPSFVSDEGLMLLNSYALG